MWQHRRLKKLGLNVDEPIIENPRIGVFNLWGLGTGPEKFSLQPFYVHSKVSIVDDKWATIGTANIDGSSLSGAEEFKQVTDPDLNLNMEINALILDVEEKSASVTKLREELWGEHLGLSPQNKPKGGWLQLWRDVALKNVDSLKKDKPYLNGQILPYTPARSARDKIQSLGIANTNINVFD
jgi:phosphatidylserine/phosphatidylglycerophosphate/cardiolipin synthase-like enzyme